MTNQELKKLSRKDLLELLIAQSRQRDALLSELDTVKAALQNREIHLEQAGSIAEASLQLNGVFEAAQAAAQQYLDNIRQKSRQMEEYCIKKEEEINRRCHTMEEEVRFRCQTIEDETRCRCQDMENEAKEKAEAYWAEVSKRIEIFCREHEGFKEMLPPGGEI